MNTEKNHVFTEGTDSIFEANPGEINLDEINVYGNPCGVVKIHCLYDCWGDTPWITTAQ